MSKKLLKDFGRNWHICFLVDICVIGTVAWTLSINQIVVYSDRLLMRV
jgi:hypothetical protein